MVERRFPRSFRALGAIFAFVDDFLAESRLDRDHAFDIDLVIEELFTNMVKYNLDGRHDILVRLEADAEKITILLRDDDVEAFDPTQARPVDVDAPLSDRRAGGIGIHLVRCLADEMRYDYRDRTSTVTVTRRLKR